MHPRERSSYPTRPLPEPIPGTGVPCRGLFVSRWGALLQRPARRGLPAFHPGLLTAGAAEGLFRILQRSWNLYLVGNEDEVAYGRAADEEWQAFEQALLEHLAGQGIRVTRQYACLEHPRGKGKHKRDSVFLFPNTGVLYHAAQEDGVILGQSWMLSDDVHELAAGWRSGARVGSVRRAGTLSDGDLHVEPQLSAGSLAEALKVLAHSDEFARR